ncbi:hypothetical protein MRX96_049656 [Rhipicephalus microplus]
MKLACLLVFAAGAAARSIQQCGEASTLRQLHVMFRHGDRTPTSLYPNDPNSPSDFPEGLGHITHKGKNDQYNLGKYLRTKYEDFFDLRFQRNASKKLCPRTVPGEHPDQPIRPLSPTGQESLEQ